MDYEGKGTEQVEKFTGRVPSLIYFGLAVGSMAASAALVLTGRKQLGNFIGQWAPSILVIGLYNKLVKEIALPRREVGTGMGGRMSTGVRSDVGAGAHA
jgi:hypothetical protein